MTLAVEVLLVWSAVYASVASWALARRTRTRPRVVAAPSRRRVLLVRPCAGAEPDLRTTLASSGADADHLYVRFAVATSDDAAARVAAEVAAELRALGHDAVLCVTGASAPNRKADQIARVLAAAPDHEVVVVADSDVLLSPGDVNLLVSSLEESGVTAAWSPPVEDRAGAGVGDMVSASVLRATMQAFPLLAALDPGCLVGKLVAVRRDALEAVGSFGGLVTFLGEDMELARRLRARGGRTVARGVARTRPRGRSLRDVRDRYGRWLGVIRSQRPHLLWTYPAFFFLAFPATVLALAAGGTAGNVAAALFLGARIAVAFGGAPGQWRRPGRSLLEALAGDVMLAVALLSATATRGVSWRGVSLRLTRATLEADE